MTQHALFSEYMMFDRPFLGHKTREVPAGGKRANAADSLEAILVAALAGFRERVSQQLTTSPTLAKGVTSADLDMLMRTMDDFVHGRVVALRLGADITKDRQIATRQFLETLVRVSGNLPAQRQEDVITKLADVLLPDDLADARGALAQDNLRLRDRFIAETAPLTSVEISTLAGHKSANPYATAARWKKSGAIFSVKHRDAEYFPAFQFRDGQPHPTVKKALAALPEKLSPWQRAFWFVSTNGWLNDKAPAELLDEPEAVVEAACHEGLEVIG